MKIKDSDEPNYLFPTYEDMAELLEKDSHFLDDLGLNKMKKIAIKEITNFFIKNKNSFNNKRDTILLEKELLKLKGIGKWTAQYIIMRSTLNTNILLDSDYVIKNIINEFKINKIIFKQFEPFNSYITIGLWNLSTRRNK